MKYKVKTSETSTLLLLLLWSS